VTNYFSFSRFAGIALVGTIMTGSLVGCQQNTSAVDSEEATEEHAEHTEHAHEEHGHDEEHEEHGHDEHEGHEGHDHASNSTPFSCEPTAIIGVSYHSDNTPQTAHLLIDGIKYDLTATADANIYTSDIGLDETHGIIWQVNGDKATLLKKTLDSDVAIDKEDVLFNCQKS
tara:strand:- start:42297 stop:42809 length:513 start_codon:yes stop_codon:yes gene_type:complete